MRMLVMAVVAVAAVSATSARSFSETGLRPPTSVLDSTAIGPRSSTIDDIFSPYNHPDSPGCSVGVFQNGATAFAKGYGMASLEHDVPITPESVFYAGSVSKQFTAMATALAMQQGKLAYDDPIRKYLPELPPYADRIKVSHLLHHTSGLRDYNTLLSIGGRRDEDAWDNRVVLQMTARQTALNFEPGAEYLYSNTGYTLLATIVERATGTKFADFADANVFKPLGMTVTHYHTDARRLVHNRALGYGGRAGAWTLDTPINERAGAGGLYTNIPDLQKWDENFYSGKVGGADVLRRLQTRGVLNDGTTLAYAWGLEIGEYRGLPIVEHSGSLGGYRAHILRVPGQHTSVALLCNVSSVVTTALVRRVADVVLADRFTAPLPAAQGGAPGSAASAVQTPRPYAGGATGRSLGDEFGGVYYSDELAATFTIRGMGDALVLSRETDTEPAPLARVGPAEFRGRGLTLNFVKDASGLVTALTVDAGRVRGIAFKRR